MVVKLPLDIAKRALGAVWVTAVAVACATGPTPAPQSSPPPEPGRRVGLPTTDSIIRSLIASQRLAGASVLVVRGSDTLLRSDYGFANLEHGVPVDSATVLRI